MKNIGRCAWLVTLASAFLLGIAGVAFSHPPREIALSLKPGGVLVVDVAHSVDNPQKHYIFRVTVYVDDKIAEQREYGSQQNAESMTDNFSLGALPSGAKIKVEASCVIMGSAASSITVP
ncbi:MAG: hypothetical protein LBS75_00995 [Synergistaceae bacterium]|jgi:hypothetical protein|nr:hypothetical protein [Synergistaceae bacterium]